MRTILIVILLLITGATGWYIGTVNGRRKETTSSIDPLEAKDRIPAYIRGIGKLEPKSGIIKIFVPTGQKIDTLFDLKIGDEVTKDQPLVRFSGAQVREMELEIALAKKKDAENQLEFEKSKAQLERKAAQLALAEAQAGQEAIANQGKNIELLRSQRQVAIDYLKQLSKLRSDEATEKLVGDAEFKKQELLVEQLQSQITQGLEEIRLASEQSARAEAVAQIDLSTIDFVIQELPASIPMQTIDKAIEAAKLALELAEIKSPIAGTVLDIAVPAGDTATNQPVMLIGDTTEMVCVAEINDNQMQHVKINARATLKSLAFTGTISGRVISKGIMIGPPSLQDPNPFAGVDRKTGQVVISIDTNATAKDFVNLQVHVEIEIEVD